MKKYSRILIILVVLLLVLGVYFLKNGRSETAMVNAAVDTAIEDKKAENAKVEETIDPVPDEIVIETAPEKAEVTPDRIPMEFTVWNEEELFSTGLPLMLDFGSASCGPCQMMKPDLIAFYEESYGKVSVRYADVWADPSLTGGLPVSAVPTQFFFYPDGRPYEPSVEMQKKTRFQMYVRRDNDEHVLTAHVGILDRELMKEIIREMGVEL